jgi:glycosyltransferase involved in cell wall biosynthesis
MRSKISIFSILDSPALGGAEQYLLSNLEFLSQQGFNITLATYNQKIKAEYQKKFNLINLPYRLDLIGDIKGLIKFFIQAPLAILWLIKVLLKLKNKYQQVIIYTPGFTERLVFSPFIKLLGLKLAWLEYGPIESVFKHNFGLPKIVYWLVSFFPDKVITISNHSQLSMIKHSPVNESKIRVIYPGTPTITPSLLKKLQTRGRKWKVQQKLKSKKIISFTGRLASEKEVDVLLKAFSKLKRKNIQLVIIGTGPEKKIYQNLANKLKIASRVTFTNFVSESKKNTILAISDIFVFPSAWKMEGFGMTTIEAMMVGTPVISTGAGPQKEIITNEKTGLFFKARNDIDLSLKIEKLLSNKQLCKKIATSGRKKAMKEFSQTQMLQKTLELIQSLGD